MKLKKTEFRCVVCNAIYKSVDGEWTYHKGFESLHCIACASQKKVTRLVEDATNRIMAGSSDDDDVLSILAEIKTILILQTCLPRSPRSR